MSITLNTYNNGDTNYVAKMNQDNANLTTAVNNLLTSVAAANGLSVGTLLLGLFGLTPAFIGNSSYTNSQAGTTITIQPGYVWKPSATALLQLASSTAVNLVGQAGGTYYIVPDVNGTPALSTSATDAIYQIVWSGTAFTSVTRLATIFMSAADENGLLTSTTNTVTYATLLARLEAIEAQANVLASNTVFGKVKVDGTTIVASGGVISAALNSLPICFGFGLENGSAASNAAPMLVAPKAGTLTTCVVITKASDATTPFTFDVLKNGSSVFASPRTVAAGTASGTVNTFSLSSSSISVIKGDKFQINVSSGSTSWKATVQVES